MKRKAPKTKVVRVTNSSHMAAKHLAHLTRRSMTTEIHDSVRLKLAMYNKVSEVDGVEPEADSAKLLDQFMTLVKGATIPERAMAAASMTGRDPGELLELATDVLGYGLKLIQYHGCIHLLNEAPEVDAETVLAALGAAWSVAVGAPGPGPVRIPEDEEEDTLH